MKIFTKQTTNGRMIIRDEDKVIVNIKDSFSPSRNVKIYCAKHNIAEFKIEAFQETEAASEKVYVLKKDAKEGDLVKLFGADYVAYTLNGVIKFRKQ